MIQKNSRTSSRNDLHVDCANACVNITKILTDFTYARVYRTNVVMNYTEVEGKVREATNDDPWGPTGPLMQELAHATFTYEHFPEVMSMLWRRMLQDNKTNWRRTYKVSSLFITNAFNHATLNISSGNARAKLSR